MSNGSDEGSGSSCVGNGNVYNSVNGVTSGLEWQCVELINRLYLTKGWTTATWPGDAGNPLWDNAPANLTKEANGSVTDLAPGDVIDLNEYDNGAFIGGHAGIVDGSASVTSGTVNVVSQNSGSSTNATPQRTASITNGNVVWAGGSSGTYTYSVVGVIHAPAGGGPIADGSFVSYQGNVYRMAGGAPLYVSSWTPFGGPQPTQALSDQQWAGLRSYPADGTVIRTAQNGEIYVVVGGAPTYVTTCTVTCAAQANIDQWDVDNAGLAPTHLRAYPADGTVIRAAQSGEIYVVAGGAPLYVSSCAVSCAAQANIDQWDVDNAGLAPTHLRPYPSDGTFLNTTTGAVYEVAGGAPFGVDSWSTVGGQQPYTNIDQWDIDNRTNPAAHLLVSPVGGTVVSGLPSGAQWSFGSQACRNSVSGVTSAVPVPDSGISSYTVCPMVSAPSLPAAVRGVAYSASLSASGGVGAYAWSVASGSPPAGLSLSSSGTVSGTPSTVGSSSFTVQVADESSPALTASAVVTMTVVPIAVSTSSLPLVAVDVGYHATLVEQGGTAPFTWKVVSGTLPNGVSLSSAGVLSGTPTVVGSSEFTVQVSDANNPAETATRVLSMTVLPMTVATTSLVAAPVGRAYSGKLTTSGGRSTFKWTITSGSLPAGLALTAAGVIGGTPSTVGTFHFNVSVSDSSQPANTASATLSITVTPMQITTTSLPNGVVKKAFSAKLAVSGGKGTLTFGVKSGALPPGVKMSTGGVFSGKPTLAGTFTFTVTVHDSSRPANIATATYAVTVS